ncbi:uncharacterized protein LOC128643154 [Bombina bombina]|uniref:uncharacterized protein LOC128643154 n=1 Tax=Bombina bombina TaxID=8345 RepID=UPI00235A729A|nr:uncharacterized protein LOC128643154 [Bombina bombina]
MADESIMSHALFEQIRPILISVLEEAMPAIVRIMEQALSSQSVSPPEETSNLPSINSPNWEAETGERTKKSKIPVKRTQSPLPGEDRIPSPEAKRSKRHSSSRRNVSEPKDTHMPNVHSNMDNQPGTRYSEASDTGNPHQNVISRPAQYVLSSQNNGCLLDRSGVPYFDPSFTWAPADHIARYLQKYLRKPLTKPQREFLQRECPRPYLAGMEATTPEFDWEMKFFMLAYGRVPQSRADKCLQSVQDRLLDITGPLAQIFQLAEEAICTGSRLDPFAISGLAQRAICLLGNANVSFNVLRRRAALVKANPRLADLSRKEPGSAAKGLLFGNSFIRHINRYVPALTSGRSRRYRGSLPSRPVYSSRSRQHLDPRRRQPNSGRRLFPSRDQPEHSRRIHSQVRGQSNQV